MLWLLGVSVWIAKISLVSLESSAQELDIILVGCVYVFTVFWSAVHLNKCFIIIYIYIYMPPFKFYG